MSSVLAHLLLVDDEQQILRALKPALAAAGYAVATAETGHEAMAYLAGEACDVVILDLGLPDMDGKAVISRIREWSATSVVPASPTNTMAPLPPRRANGLRTSNLDQSTAAYASQTTTR